MGGLGSHICAVHLVQSFIQVSMHKLFIAKGHDQPKRCTIILRSFLLECTEAYQIHSEPWRMHDAVQCNCVVSIRKFDLQADRSETVDQYVLSITYRYFLI